MAVKNRNATMQDVAALAGVSMMTVSRVLADERKVRQVTQDKVQAAILQLNYKPNMSARSLASSRSRLLAFLYQNSSEGYVGQLLIGALKQCQACGYNLVVGSLDGKEEDFAKVLNGLLERNNIGGIILPPPLSDSAYVLDFLASIDIPVIKISPQKTQHGFSYVCMDESKAAFDMTEYLIKQGHTRIAFIKGPADHSGSHLRYQGFVKALEKHGLALPENYIEEGLFTYRSGFEAAEILLSQKDRPTAIFSCNDDMAAATLSVAQKCNLSVPDQLSVVGFDDAAIATSIWPPLTTVRQPILSMAEKAIDILIRQLEAKNTEADEEMPQKNVLDFDLVMRGTVLPPSAM